MNFPDIARHRLLSQHIAAQTFQEPAEVVAWMGAIQAQDFLGAKWSVGLRLPAATEQDVEQALAEQKIIRTWPMRGTLHFVAPADVRWMLELLTPRIIARSALRQKQLELDIKVFARCEKLLVQALEGGKQMSRDAVCELLEANGVSTASQRGYHILWRLAQEGLICFGAPEGKQQTFVLLEEWIPKAKKLTREEALAGLAKRYFVSHGPATIQDFVWWSGLKVADAQVGLDLGGSQLAQEKVDDKTYWLSAEIPSLGRTPSQVFLLPGFDEFMLGYTDRSAALAPQHANKICPGSNGMFTPTIVIDGQVAGTWKRTLKKTLVNITPSHFNRFTKAQQDALSHAAERYGNFVRLPAKVAA
jgi:Winged helix DNA-binding domain